MPNKPEVPQKPIYPSRFEVQTIPSSEVMLQEYLTTARSRGIMHEVDVITEEGDFVCIDGIEYLDPDQKINIVPNNMDQRAYPQRLKEVGKFEMNGGWIAFVDENGAKFLGAYNDKNVAILEKAGYKQGTVAVDLSHGEEPTQEEDRQKFREIQRKEKARQLEEFIQVGMNLIKAGEHERSIRFFQNPSTAQRLGFNLDVHLLYEAPELIERVTKVITLPAGIDAVINDCANNSWFYPKDKNTSMSTIKLAFPLIADPFPSELAHNIALLHAEEWLHALQLLKGEKPLDNNIIALGLDPNSRKVNFREVDVALYLHKNGIPLTPQFLGRYGGERARAIYGDRYLDYINPEYKIVSVKDEDSIQKEEVLAERTQLPAISVEYDKSLESAPYEVSINTQQLTALFREFGMSDEDIAKHSVTLTRKFTPNMIAGLYNANSHKITIAFDPIWQEYQEALKLAKDIVNKRKSPNKSQFKKSGISNEFLYTNRLPGYLAKAPPERGLQFAQKILLNALIREENSIILHESKHALDAKLRPEMIHQIVGPLTKWSGAVLLAMQLLAGHQFTTEEVIGTFVVSFLADNFLQLTPREQSAKKFEAELKNHPDWRSIITIKPK
ncbi:MAG: hypothetical protein HYT83_03285 [Candidatus Levybacteria bacterium]|nr:hypothetical protein [Candidatus Levybacteria bacterium]